MSDPTGRKSALTRNVSIRLDLNLDPTWGDLRAYVAACADKPDGEVLGLEIDSDDYTGTTHLDALYESI